MSCDVSELKFDTQFPDLYVGGKLHGCSACVGLGELLSVCKPRKLCTCVVELPLELGHGYWRVPAKGWSCSGSGSSRCPSTDRSQRVADAGGRCCKPGRRSWFEVVGSMTRWL